MKMQSLTLIRQFLSIPHTLRRIPTTVRSLSELKRYDAAVAAYDAAIAIKSDLEAAWLGRGDVFWKLRRYDEALASYDRATALKPDLEIPNRPRSNDKAGTRGPAEKAKIAIVIPTINSQAIYRYHRKIL